MLLCCAELWGDALIGAKQRVMVRAGRLAFTLVASRRRARRRTHTPAGLDGTCEVAAAYRSMPAQALLPATDKERFLAGYGTASPRPPLPNPSKRARAARGYVTLVRKALWHAETSKDERPRRQSIESALAPETAVEWSVSERPFSVRCVADFSSPACCGVVRMPLRGEQH